MQQPPNGVLRRIGTGSSRPAAAVRAARRRHPNRMGWQRDAQEKGFEIGVGHQRVGSRVGCSSFALNEPYLRAREMHPIADAAVEVHLIFNVVRRDRAVTRHASVARAAYVTFGRTWAKRCPGVVTSLREGDDELLTFFAFPKAQWKALRSTNVIERLYEEFRRRVKTQGSLPSEDAAVVLLFSLVASGQIKLRRIDGWRKIAAVLSQHTAVAA